MIADKGPSRFAGRPRFRQLADLVCDIDDVGLRVVLSKRPRVSQTMAQDMSSQTCVGSVFLRAQLCTVTSSLPTSC